MRIGQFKQKVKVIVVVALRRFTCVTPARTLEQLKSHDFNHHHYFSAAEKLSDTIPMSLSVSTTLCHMLPITG